MTNKAYYFQHDYNAAYDEKIMYLRSIFGMEGYGLYWYIIELMHQNPDSKLRCKLINGLAYQLNIEIEKLNCFYDNCIEIGLFVTDGQFYWSDRVLINKELQEEKRKIKSFAGKKGMESRWGVITENNIAITKDNKGKEIKGKESKIKESKVVSRQTLFSDTEFNDIDKFKSAFLGTQYESANFEYYHEVIKNWSDAKGEKKLNWIATAKNWMARDLKDGKFIHSNYNPNAERINQNQQLSYAEREAIRRNSL
jgi:hypothetical protein